MDSLRKAIDNNIFYVDGLGGTGKSFLFDTLIHWCRSNCKSVIGIAWTGIAAQLFDAGQTVHTCFSLPIDLLPDTTPNIMDYSEKAKFLRNCDMIIWDEATIAPAAAYDCIDTYLRDLMKTDIPFGGKILLMGGDFRQCLPILPRGTIADILACTVKKSRIWKHAQQLKLHRNMRVNEAENDFKQWLSNLGTGNLPSTVLNSHESLVAIPDPMVLPYSENALNELVDYTWGSTSDEILDTGLNKNSGILCPINEDSFQLNEKVLLKIDKQMHPKIGITNIECNDDDQADQYPPEFAQNLTPNNLPPHILNLKEGCVVMLLKNLNTNEGLSNGTRLIVTRITDNLVYARIKSGPFQGKDVFIPRMVLRGSEDLPFTIARRQFPIRLAFAMTINKSQGQTMDKIGLYLPQPVFAHGQLYVALSRARSMDSIKVLVCNTNKQGMNTSDGKTYTVNVVYKSVFQD